MCFCFTGASKLDVAGIVQGFKEPFCRFVKTIRDVIDDLGDTEPGRLQAAYRKYQKPNICLETFSYLRRTGEPFLLPW